MKSANCLPSMSRRHCFCVLQCTLWSALEAMLPSARGEQTISALLPCVVTACLTTVGRCVCPAGSCYPWSACIRGRCLATSICTCTMPDSCHSKPQQTRLSVQNPFISAQRDGAEANQPPPIRPHTSVCRDCCGDAGHRETCCATLGLRWRHAL